MYSTCKALANKGFTLLLCGGIPRASFPPSTALPSLCADAVASSKWHMPRLSRMLCASLAAGLEVLSSSHPPSPPPLAISEQTLLCCGSCASKLTRDVCRRPIAIVSLASCPVFAAALHSWVIEVVAASQGWIKRLWRRRVRARVTALDCMSVLEPRAAARRSATHRTLWVWDDWLEGLTER